MKDEKHIKKEISGTEPSFQNKTRTKTKFIFSSMPWGRNSHWNMTSTSTNSTKEGKPALNSIKLKFSPNINKKRPKYEVLRPQSREKSQKSIFFNFTPNSVLIATESALKVWKATAINTKKLTLYTSHKASVLHQKIGQHLGFNKLLPIMDTAWNYFQNILKYGKL